MDTKALESLEEATQSKDSVSFPLVDDVSEIILHESGPDQVTPAVTTEEEKDGSEEATRLIVIHGQIFHKIISGSITLIYNVHVMAKCM